MQHPPLASGPLRQGTPCERPRRIDGYGALARSPVRGAVSGAKQNEASSGDRPSAIDWTAWRPDDRCAPAAAAARHSPGGRASKAVADLARCEYADASADLGPGVLTQELGNLFGGASIQRCSPRRWMSSGWRYAASSLFRDDNTAGRTTRLYVLGARGRGCCDVIAVSTKHSEV